MHTGKIILPKESYYVNTDLLIFRIFLYHVLIYFVLIFALDQSHKVP